jgi:hypothetical protein
LSIIVVPAACRQDILERLHISHGGITKTKALASSLYWWPGLHNDVEQMIHNCAECQLLRPSQQQEPAVRNENPIAPMSHVGIDLFDLDGQTWVLVMDNYSGWPFAAQLSSLNTEAVTKKCAEWFDTFGWPLSIRADGGPQFRSNFSEFCRTHHMDLQTSSPYNSRANGLVKSGVKSINIC